MTKSDFRTKAMLLLGALIGFILVFPYILQALIGLSNCRGVGGACGALAAVIGVFLRPAAVVLIGLWLIWSVFRRQRDLGVGVGWSVAALLWLFGSMQLLVGFGNFWGANFALGIITVPSMVLVAMLLLVIAFLCFAEPSAVHSDRSDNRMAWIVAIVAGVHATLLLSHSVIFGALTMPLIGKLVSPLLVPLMGVLRPITNLASLGLAPRMAGVLGWIDVAVFGAALAYLILQQKGDGDAPVLAAEGGGLPPRRPMPSSRSAGLAAIAPQKSFGTRRA